MLWAFDADFAVITENEWRVRAGEGGRGKGTATREKKKHTRFDIDMHGYITIRFTRCGLNQDWTPVAASCSRGSVLSVTKNG